MKIEDEELLEVIYKTLEIFKTIKDTRLKVYNRVLNIDDKKILSIIQGILDTNNEVGNRLNKLGLNYGIIVKTEKMSEEDYNKVYAEYFNDLVTDEDMRLENILCSLINNQFFIELNKNAGVSLEVFKDILEDSKVKVYKRNKVI